jgi:hypothetical protein
MRAGHWFIIGVLLCFLAATVWYGVEVWRATSAMPAYAYIAMVAGAVMSLNWMRIDSSDVLQQPQRARCAAAGG